MKERIEKTIAAVSIESLEEKWVNKCSITSYIIRVDGWLVERQYILKNFLRAYILINTEIHERKSNLQRFSRELEDYLHVV